MRIGGFYHRVGASWMAWRDVLRQRAATVDFVAPTVLRDGQFRLFFFSREETRIHVHVSHPEGEAKFWLTPLISVATSTGLTQRQLREAHAIVEAHIEEIRNAWSRHFGA